MVITILTKPRGFDPNSLGPNSALAFQQATYDKIKDQIIAEQDTATKKKWAKQCEPPKDCSRRRTDKLMRDQSVARAMNLVVHGA